MLTDLLLSRNQTILNVNEMKKAYLQELKLEKSGSKITVQQYYSSPEVPANWISQEPQAPQVPQAPSWMFKPVE